MDPNYKVSLTDDNFEPKTLNMARTINAKEINFWGTFQSSLFYFDQAYQTKNTTEYKNQAKNLVGLLNYIRDRCNEMELETWFMKLLPSIKQVSLFNILLETFNFWAIQYKDEQSDELSKEMIKSTLKLISILTESRECCRLFDELDIFGLFQLYLENPQAKFKRLPPLQEFSVDFIEIFARFACHKEVIIKFTPEMIEYVFNYTYHITEADDILLPMSFCEHFLNHIKSQCNNNFQQIPADYVKVFKDMFSIINDYFCSQQLESRIKPENKKDYLKRLSSILYQISFFTNMDLNIFSYRPENIFVFYQNHLFEDERLPIAIGNFALNWIEFFNYFQEYNITIDILFEKLQTLDLSKSSKLARSIISAITSILPTIQSYQTLPIIDPLVSYLLNIFEKIGYELKPHCLSLLCLIFGNTQKLNEDYDLIDFFITNILSLIQTDVTQYKSYHYIFTFLNQLNDYLRKHPNLNPILSENFLESIQTISEYLDPKTFQELLPFASQIVPQ